MSFYERLLEWANWSWPLLVNHLWQATLFFLLILIACTLLKRSPARVRYSLWLVASLKFILPSTVISWLIGQAGFDVASLFTSDGGKSASELTIVPLLSPVTSTPVVLQVIEPATQGIEPTAIAYTSLQSQNYWYVALTLIWIIGCALLLGLWLKKRRALCVAMKSGKIVSSGREFEILQRVQLWLGLRRKVALVVSDAIAEPGVWRIWRPVIVMPEGICDCLDDRELETIMMHEMVHVERWDNLIGVLQRVVCCVLWFHPLVWLLDRQLLAEREQSCDDTVIKLSDASEAYASGIKKVCRYSIGWELSGLSGAAGSNLKKRIRRINAADAVRNPSVLHRALLGAMASALILFSVVAGLVDGGEATARHNNAAVDSRFVVADSEEAGADVDATIKEAALKPPPFRQQARETLQQANISSDAPIEVRAEADKIEPPPQIILNDINQPQTGNPPPMPVAAPPTTTPIFAAIIPASATRADSSEFVGRYEVDPKQAENFILDITLERGELWLKPSHASKRKLLRTTEHGLIDVYSDFRLTAIRDGRGRITGLRLDSWSSNITARKLSLPQPSLKGTVTFRLKGYSSAKIVAVAGTFNNWNQSQLLFAREGDEWVCRVNLPRGKYQYKFIVDGDWINDPNNPRIESDERGFRNSLLMAE